MASEYERLLDKHTQAVKHIHRLWETIDKLIYHLEWALYYADPPHPAAKQLLNEAQEYFDSLNKTDHPQ